MGNKTVKRHEKNIGRIDKRAPAKKQNYIILEIFFAYQQQICKVSIGGSFFQYSWID